MKNTLTLTIAACILLASCGEQAATNTTDSEHHNTQNTQSAFTVDYEKFTLENGLEVILHVDKSDPIVAFTTVVHVGSNREIKGRTGFAHFFEHMAFNDSENVPRGWNRKAIPDWGGSRNGGTWNDGTIYYEVVPKDAFDKIMWIDSDRLGYMLNTVTKEALEREKQVVKNEKRQRVDNAAYGYTSEVIRKNLYPEGHPYSWTVIGALPDLQAATLDNLKDFYNQYYGAANATLVIAGDIDVAETKKKVDRWFGEIRKGADIKPLKPTPISLDSSKSFYFEDNFAKLPELRMTFPTVESYHKDQYALDVLAQLLAGSKNSPLYKGIVEQAKLAPGVSSYNNSMELAGEFVFRIRANSNTDLDSIMAELQKSLMVFEEKGADEKDLQRIKAELETRLYNGISTVLGKSNQLATDNEFSGDPLQAIKSAELIRAVTTDDLMAAYNKYIKNMPSIMTSFVPKGKADLALEGSELASVWIEEVKESVSNEEVSQGTEAVYEKTASKYDRSEPPFGELPLVTMPEIWEGRLGNDIRVLGIENSETPVVAFDVTVSGGAWMDPLDKKGVASLLASLMNEGTAAKTAAELEQEIGLLGSGITVRASTNEITISGTTLARNFGKTVALVNEILTSPRWDQADFDRVKSKAMTRIKGREASPTSIGRLAFQKVLYGSEHPLGYPSSGNAETVSNIEMDDLKAFHQAVLSSSVSMHIAGDIKQDLAQKDLQLVASSFNEATTVMPIYTIPEQKNAGKVFFIDVPGSKQSVLNIGKIALEGTHLDANKLDFTNEKLGGGISGDLAQTLRIEKGYTYGAVSFIQAGLAPMPFLATTSVRANATQASLDIIKDMITKYGPEYNEAGVEMTRQKVIKSSTRAFESLYAKLGTLRNISKYGKSLKYIEGEQQELLNMNLSEFKRIAKEYLAEPDMLYVIVGDKETQFGPVSEFAGGEVIELDIHANPVKKSTKSAN